ncbi:hypothetical protein Nepgr_015414 [Nepenthes gracilis]|uniref:MADS-box domain-containing protein n=1 Tax=Nepenthes gracilis TaxID=150966 RepID=A0AAD3XQP1_NEPGR|nr:hypothetical protein Nepgr_015414 [Nepenthes gracilis]
MVKKTSLGRQKIKIAKIEIPNHRQVTFSKRRSGLFKKACELCTLCGVEIVIIVFSPAQKVFSFGHPDVESLVDRFFRPTHPGSSSGTRRVLEGTQRNTNVHELNTQLTLVTNLVDAEKKRGESLDRMREARLQSRCWWEAAVDKLKLHELEQLCVSMEELKKNVANQASKLLMETSNSIGMRNSMAIVEQFESKPVDILGSSSSVPSGFDFGHGFGIF